MFGRKNARIAELEYNNACLCEALEDEQLASADRLKEIAKTGVQLTNVNTELRICIGRVDMLTAERDKLAGELQAANAKLARQRSGLIPGGPKAKAKRDAQTKPANGAAVQGAVS